MKARSKNDTRALEEIAGVLGAIIERDEKRGLPTTGLESSKREIEWAAMQGRSQSDAGAESKSILGSTDNAR